MLHWRLARSGLVAALMLGHAAPAVAQAVDPPPAEGTPPPPAEGSAPEPPLQPEPPAMPRPDEDFTVDRELFREIETDPERGRAAEVAREQAPVQVEPPLYQRFPRLTILTQAAAGVFGAGVVGLLGGSIGNAIDEADERFPLGGAHGPAIGAGAGALVGTTLGVWGAGLLFEKDGGVGWTGLGTLAGAVVGSGTALGILFGFEESNTTSGAAVASFLVFQVAGAVLFNDLFTPVEPVAGVGPSPPGRAPPSQAPPPGAWLLPVASGRF